jgi:TonB-linked SusC/RagA family outer membrane protein
MQAAWAQVEVKGKVTDAADGTVLPGVSIIVQGTLTGTVTDVDGKYVLSVPEGYNVLIFSFVGMLTQEVNIDGRTIIDVAMEEDVVGLDEVVVTALGVSREKKSLGYSVQDVSGDEINQARQTNVVNSLSGKVAGVQISSSGNLGGSSRVLIRGANSVTGENQPLFVVDGVPMDNANYSDADTDRGAGGYDYGNMAQDINPDDVASVSVLKGPAATALYGSRASNGVIMITTKSDKSAYKDARKKGIGVTWNSSVTFDRVARLPVFQNSYGGGFSFDTLWYSDHADDPNAFPNRTSGFYTGTHNGQPDSYDLLAQYAVDESWGPYLDGQKMYRPWYSFESQIPEYYGVNVPWESSEGNVRDFFQTGQTWTNNFAFYGGSDAGFFRLSYTNMKQHGVMPASELTRNTISFTGNTKLGNKLTAFTSINYVLSEATNRPKTGYDGDNVMQQFYQWGQRQWNQEKMEQYWRNADGTHNTWNRTAWNNPFPKYTDNPYWTRYMNYPNDGRDRIYGHVGLTWQIARWVSGTVRYNRDYYTDMREERIAVGSNNISEYARSERTFSESNIEFILKANWKLTSDLNLNVDVGGNQRTNEYRRFEGRTVGGLPIPEFYNLNNSANPASIIDYKEKYRVNSLYARASFDYMSMIYLDLTGRNDWSSTLPEDNNSYFYPSATLSWIFSELAPLQDSKIISFGKVRFGWAQVGSDTDPYRLYGTYRGKESLGTNPTYTVPNPLNNEDLKPEKTSSWEVGADVRFFLGRLGLDVTYYDMRTEDLIFPVTVTGATGYQSFITNAGEMTNKGWEILLTANVLEYENFSWNLTLNWAKNKNELVKLIEGVENLRLQNGPFSVSVNATVGQPYGTILGYDYNYIDGQRLVDESGMYATSDDIVPLGSVMPDWTGGISSVFTIFKNWDLYVLFDFRKGGDMFFTSYMWGMYSGMLEETVADNIRTDGIVLEGVMEDPANPGTYIPNTTVLDAESYGLNHYFVNAMPVFETTYGKLRELSVSYTFPNKWMDKTRIRDLKISLIGRNLWTFATDIRHFDPEWVTNSGNVQGIEGARVPSTTSYGVNLSVNF